MFKVRAIGLGQVGADLPDGVRDIRPLREGLGSGHRNEQLIQAGDARFASDSLP